MSLLQPGDDFYVAPPKVPTNLQDAVKLLEVYRNIKPRYGEGNQDAIVRSGISAQAANTAMGIVSKYAMEGGDTSAFPRSIMMFTTPEYAAYRESRRDSGGKTFLDQAWNYVTSPPMMTALGGVYGVATAGAGTAAGGAAATEGASTSLSAQQYAAAARGAEAARAGAMNLNNALQGGASLFSGAQAASAPQGAASPAAGTVAARPTLMSQALDTAQGLGAVSLLMGGDGTAAAPQGTAAPNQPAPARQSARQPDERSRRAGAAFGLRDRPGFAGFAPSMLSLGRRSLLGY